MKTIVFTSFNDIFINLLRNLGWWSPVIMNIDEENEEESDSKN